jgi:hypothetical protein
MTGKGAGVGMEKSGFATRDETREGRCLLFLHPKFSKVEL